MLTFTWNFGEDFGEDASEPGESNNAIQLRECASDFTR